MNLRALYFYICKFEVNRDCRIRYTNSWSNLTLKCNANTFAKVDARVEGNCLRTISYAQGYFCPKLQLQETEWSETYSEYSSQCKKNNFMLNAGQDKRIAVYQTYFVFVPLFSKTILTRQIILSTKNSQEFLASQDSVLRRNKATNSSTSNRPFFCCTESPCTW